MITVEGYRAFNGTMLITPRTNFYAPFEIKGDFLYKPDTDCWYWEGHSFPAITCLIRKDNHYHDSDYDKQLGEFTEFEKICEPVIEWLNEHYHPHVSVVITPVSAELQEGIMILSCGKYIED